MMRLLQKTSFAETRESFEFNDDDDDDEEENIEEV